MDKTSCAGLFSLVRQKRPLVHHITNLVTINDCANITLCAGASPVMAEAPEEAAEMVAVSGALVLNIGTLSLVQVESMILAGSRANELGIPVILDPVGAGATRMRTKVVFHLLEELDIAILKGNPGEIGIISGFGGTVHGVDSGGVSGDPVKAVRECARITGAVVAMTGEIDIVADERRVFLIGNGTPMLGELSGTGCMASSVTGAFAAVSDDLTTAAVAALAAFGLAGERAAARCFGPYSFRTALFDGMYTLTPGDLAAGAKVRVPDGV
ncbi:MAG: hydroxyethylthiazole kinase [Methanoregulaceae archaeon]|nr:hydroxyethylthiazole kinase [Methanoregulaceae archaeon]